MISVGKKIVVELLKYFVNKFSIQKGKVSKLLLLAIALFVSHNLAADTFYCAKYNEYAPVTTSRLVSNNDGTVSDPINSLVWKTCSEGQVYNASIDDCADVAQTLSWEGAFTRVEKLNLGLEGENLGFTDWRLPNIKELASIIERSCYDPAVNTAILPSTLSSGYWSSTHSSEVAPHRAWIVNFRRGDLGETFKSSNLHIRLVRDGD